MTEQRKVIRWENPPPVRLHGKAGPKVRRSQWDLVVRELQANPGKWAVVAEGLKTQTLPLGIGVARNAFKRGCIVESTTRSSGDRIVVYARSIVLNHDHRGRPAADR